MIFVGARFLLYRQGWKRLPARENRRPGRILRLKMSEPNQPFTEQVTRANRGPANPNPARLPWIIAGILAASLVAALLLWATAVGKLRGLEPLRSQLDDSQANLASALAQVNKDKDELAALTAQVADLQKEKDSVAQSAKGLEDEMRSDLESKDVTISRLQGKLTVNILDRVMFDSGEAILQPAGETVMRKIAALLAAHPTLKIHVIGHTDNVPIRSRFASNWELSTARALAAVHFLTERAGVDPRRVGAVGYGEYRPIADNATAEGRAKNRRIAITILPDELAGADTVSTAVAPLPVAVAAPKPIPAPPTMDPPAAEGPMPPAQPPTEN
jgi:chemotaxis protein MotB